MKLTFKQKLRRWLMNDDDEYDVPHTISVSDEHEFDGPDTIRFSVTDAIGGRIVQVRVYESKHDHYNTKTHIVTPEENLAEALAHIFTLERIGR